MFVLFRDSCQRGWRLLYILTAFHRCSDVMKPFLLRFLQDACDSPGMPYQGMQSTDWKWLHYSRSMLQHNFKNLSEHLWAKRIQWIPCNGHGAWELYFEIVVVHYHQTEYQSQSWCCMTTVHRLFCYCSGCNENNLAKPHKWIQRFTITMLINIVRCK